MAAPDHPGAGLGLAGTSPDSSPSSAFQARQALTEIIDPGGIKALPATYVVSESAGPP